MLDISSKGAKVVVKATSAIPDRFELAFFESIDKRRTCEVVWRRGKVLGVKFILLLVRGRMLGMLLSAGFAATLLGPTSMRAVGENPAAADSVGIPVRWIRFVYLTLGSAVSATSGYLTFAFIPSWSEGITAGRGWISVALVIFAGYQPIHIAIGALLFGCVSALSYVGQAQNWAVPSAILSMLPYIATLAAMMIPKLFLQNMRSWGAAPQAPGTAYFRDQR